MAIKIHFKKEVSIDLALTIKVILFSIIYKFTTWTYNLLLFSLLKRSKSKEGSSTNYKEGMQILKMYLLGSTHPRRSNFSYIALNNISNCVNFSKSERSSLRKEPFWIYKSDYALRSKGIKEFIYCGDSHVEFLSRVKINSKGQGSIHPKALWLGPKTLVGFSTDKKQQDWLKEKLNRLSKEKHIMIVMCLGHIDIRTTLGFLLSINSISSIDEGIELILRSYISINEGIFNYLEKSGVGPIGHLSIPPASAEMGINLSNCTKESALEHQRNDPYTIFGSNQERARWTSMVNQAISETAQKRGWWFVDNTENYKEIQDPNGYFIDKRFSFDLHHINSPETYKYTLIKSINSYYL